MLRPTKSSTPIRCWACRRPATRTRSAGRGSRCAKPARPREPCSWRRRRSAGMSIRRPAARKAVKCFTRRRDDASAMASLPPMRPACRFPRTWRSSDRRISSSSARRPSASTRRRRSTERRSIGIDVRPPGVKIATLAQSPVFGGRVKSVDDAAAKAVKGVRQIVRLDDAVAVVADHMGAAKKGLAALVIEWDDGPHAKLNTEDDRGRARTGDAQVRARLRRTSAMSTRPWRAPPPRSRRPTRFRSSRTRRWSR